MAVIVGPDGGLITVSAEQAALAEQQQKANAPPPLPTEPTLMVGSDGRTYTVPPTSYAAAIKNGWRRAQPAEIEKDASIERGVKEMEDSPIQSGAYRFANEALFGIPDTISDADATPEQREYQQAVRERTEARHPIETGIEKGLGMVAPLLIPGVGEAGEAAETLIRGSKLAGSAVAQGASISIERKIAGAAAKYATEGALYSTPQTAIQAAYGDPETAAETMLWGVGLSAVLGAGSSVLGQAASKVGKGVIHIVDDLGTKLIEKDATGMTHLDNIARNILGISDKQAKKLGPGRLTKIVEYADQEGLLAANPEARPDMIKALLKDSGAKIGNHLDKLQDLMDNDPAIKAMGPIPTDTSNKFINEVMTKFPEVETETHKELFTLVKKIRDDMLAGGSEPSFEELQKIRTEIGKGKKAFMKDTPQAAIFRLADHVIQQDLEVAAQKIYSGATAGLAGPQVRRLGLANAFPDYLKQKARYDTGMQLSENLNPFKGTGKLSAPLAGLLGLGNTAKLGLGAITGHPAIGAAYVGTKYILDNFLKNKYGMLGKSVSFLREVAANPQMSGQLGGYMAKEGMAALQTQMNKIPSILTNNIGSRVATLGVTEAVHNYIGNTAGLTKQQQYDKLVMAITSASTDTGMTAKKIGAASSMFSGNSLTLASLVAQKKYGALAYLQSQIPKDPNGVQPFSKNDWKPTKQQQAEFLQKVAVVNNPMVVWDHYKNGSMSKIERDTLMAVYPKIYNEMITKVVSTAYDPRTGPLTSDQQMKLAMFTNIPSLGPSGLKHIGKIQAVVSAPAPAGTGGMAGATQQAKPPKPSRAPKFEHSPSLLSDSQARTSRS